jgi:hypothetical protein
MHVKIFICLSVIVWIAITKKIYNQMSGGNIFELFWFLASLSISILGLYIIFGESE